MGVTWEPVPHSLNQLSYHYHIIFTSLFASLSLWKESHQAGPGEPFACLSTLFEYLVSRVYSFVQTLQHTKRRKDKKKNWWRVQSSLQVCSLPSSLTPISWHRFSFADLLVFTQIVFIPAKPVTSVRYQTLGAFAIVTMQSFSSSHALPRFVCTHTHSMHIGKISFRSR